MAYHGLHNLYEYPRSAYFCEVLERDVFLQNFSDVTYWGDLKKYFVLHDTIYGFIDKSNWSDLFVCKYLFYLSKMQYCRISDIYHKSIFLSEFYVHMEKKITMVPIRNEYFEKKKIVFFFFAS